MSSTSTLPPAARLMTRQAPPSTSTVWRPSAPGRVPGSTTTTSPSCSVIPPDRADAAGAAERPRLPMLASGAASPALIAERRPNATRPGRPLATAATGLVASRVNGGEPVATRVRLSLTAPRGWCTTSDAAPNRAAAVRIVARSGTPRATALPGSFTVVRAWRSSATVTGIDNSDVTCGATKRGRGLRVVDDDGVDRAARRCRCRRRGRRRANRRRGPPPAHRAVRPVRPTRNHPASSTRAATLKRATASSSSGRTASATHFS